MLKFSGFAVAAAAARPRQLRSKVQLDKDGNEDLLHMHAQHSQTFELEESLEDEMFSGSYVTNYGSKNETVFAGVRDNMMTQMKWQVGGEAIPKFVISLSRNNPRFAKFVDNVESVGVSLANTCRMQAVHGQKCANSVPCGQCGHPDVEGAVGMSHMAIWNHMVGERLSFCQINSS